MMAVGRQPLLNSSPIGLRAIADRPPGPRENNRVWGSPTQSGALLFLARLSVQLRSQKRTPPVRNACPAALWSQAGPLKSPASDQEQCLCQASKKRPHYLEEIVGAATLSRFVSTIPRERCIRLSATTQVPKEALSAARLHNDLARSVQY